MIHATAENAARNNLIAGGSGVGAEPVLAEKVPGEAAVRQVLMTNFPIYAERCLKIVTKAGQVEPFVLNRAQLYVHEMLERQLREKGYVRALILKGRQQGISTMIGGRFYWKTTNRKGVNTYIMSHEQKSSDGLFGMTRRYHEHCPPAIKQSTRAASSKELAFDQLDSSYIVGTAGSQEVGRGGTTQLFHGSEVAFWPNAENHLAGVLQRVPSGLLAKGTEIIFESTANGVGDMFHKMWQDAENGKSEFVAIFVPWFWQPEYRLPAPQGWEPDGPVAEMVELYEIDLEQAYWADRKIAELGDIWKFKQEYPCNAAEAFQVGSSTSFIPSKLAVEAMVPKPDIKVEGPRIGGCDPARGGDRTAFAGRQGRRIFEVKSYFTDDLMAVVQLCIEFIMEYRLDKLFIDVNGLGAGVYDRLVELGWGHMVTPVGNGGVLNPERYANKRAEITDLFKKWLYEAPVEIPNRPSLLADIIADREKKNSTGKLMMESKDTLKDKFGLKSPDESDACKLTFAFPVASSFVMRNDARQDEADTDWDCLEG